jgi:hypothetical protein
MMKKRFGAKIVLSTILNCAVVALLVSVVAIYNNISFSNQIREQQKKAFRQLALKSQFSAGSC